MSVRVTLSHWTGTGAIQQQPARQSVSVSFAIIGSKNSGSQETSNSLLGLC
jgi:hypothetical protein